MDVAVAVEMKRCSGCKAENSITAFGVNRAKRDGLAIYCRACMNVLTRRHYRANRRARLDYALERNVGITREQYVASALAYVEETP